MICFVSPVTLYSSFLCVHTVNWDTSPGFPGHRAPPLTPTHYCIPSHCMAARFGKHLPTRQVFPPLLLMSALTLVSTFQMSIADRNCFCLFQLKLGCCTELKTYYRLYFGVYSACFPIFMSVGVGSCGFSLTNLTACFKTSPK